MVKSSFASIGSVFTAFIASSCCIGPLAFTLLGAGGIGFGVGLEKYRPIMLVVTLALLGISFQMAYRPIEEDCVDGKCEVEQIRKSRKINRATLWISAGVAVIFMFVPQLLLIIT